MVDMAQVGIKKYGESSYESALKLNEAFALKIPLFRLSKTVNVKSFI